jgi:hypothetical protein
VETFAGRKSPPTPPSLNASLRQQSQAQLNNICTDPNEVYLDEVFVTADKSTGTVTPESIGNLNAQMAIQQAELYEMYPDFYMSTSDEDNETITTVTQP